MRKLPAGPLLFAELSLMQPDVVAWVLQPASALQCSLCCVSAWLHLVAWYGHLAAGATHAESDTLATLAAGAADPLPADSGAGATMLCSIWLCLAMPVCR